MSYRVEVVPHLEINLMSPSIEAFDPDRSLKGLKLHNDLVEEIRGEAVANAQLYQQKMVTYFSKKVKVK